MDFEFLSKLVGVFALSTVIFWAAIPAGIALGLSPLLTGLMTASGAYLSVLVVVFAGESVRKVFQKWRSTRIQSFDSKKSVPIETQTKQAGVFRRVWNRWGLIGIALSAPIMTGTIGGTALVVALGSQRSRILLWFAIGISIWAIILVTTISLGISAFK